MAKKEVFCTIGIDVDAVAGGWARMGEDSPCDITRGLFAGEIGSPRLLKLFDHYGLRTTWFIPGHSIETFPRQSRWWRMPDTRSGSMAIPMRTRWP